MKRGVIWWSYFNVDGVRHQHSTNTSNRKQAEAIEQKLKGEANARRFQLVADNPDLTFAEVAAQFITSSSVKRHHVDRLRQLLPYFAETPVLRISKSMTQDFRAYRQSLGSVSDATVNRDMSTLRRILYWAVDEQLLAANPLTRLKMARERRTKRQVLSIAEEELLLATAPQHLRSMIIAALDTGMRRGEITHQRWEDVDLARKVLSVTHSKTPEGECREIPMTRRLADLLLDRQDSGIVFAYEGDRIETIRRSWRTALKRAGIRHVRFHDLRHTFNTRLMEAGVLQEIRMALMSHTTGPRVHSIYTHIELPTKRKAIGMLEAWVNQQHEQLKQEQRNASTEERSEERGCSQD